MTVMNEVSVPVHEASLFLDLDGTLAPIADRPEDVGPDQLRNGLLKTIHRALGGRLAIVSGRMIEDVDRIVDDMIPCVAGIHGLERRAASGEMHIADPHPQLDRVHSILASYVRGRPSLQLEFKELGVALHYRQEPGAAADVLSIVRRLAWATGLKLQEGRMVAELRSPGADKGDTVRAFMTEAPFRGSTPIFVGDDVTDEDGFAAAQSLGGIGVHVGQRRDSKAIANLRDTQDVLEWIGMATATGFFELDVRI
jgi:trehalose 6-phosphate phosphatase